MENIKPNITLQKYTTIESLVSILKEKRFLLRNIMEYNDIFEIVDLENPQNYYATCFTKCTSTILMWAHYGNSFKGCKIVLDLSKYLELEIMFNKITYCSRKARKALPKDFEKLLCKGKRWEYEKEYRFILDLEKKDELLNKILIEENGKYYIPAFIKSVYFGVNIDKKAKDYLMALKLIEENNKIKTREKIIVRETRTSEYDYSIQNASSSNTV